MWHLSFVENVVCDEGDQSVFRKLTGRPQYLLCSGDMSHVRRPRFFWINAELGSAQDVVQEPGNEFMIIRGFGEGQPAGYRLIGNGSRKMSRWPYLRSPVLSPGPGLPFILLELPTLQLRRKRGADKTASGILPTRTRWNTASPTMLSCEYVGPQRGRL